MNTALLVMDMQRDILARVGAAARLARPHRAGNRHRARRPRARGITQLACLGIATSGIVLSTVRQAMDLDFQVVVVRDCCLDADDEVHRVLCEKVFARHAKIVDGAELAAAL